ncbi:MAG: DUF192 domain-containing protein [Schleiferiaceae bacterium]|jgi:uncharacterized membrane protein (UPF0127 family)
MNRTLIMRVGGILLALALLGLVVPVVLSWFGPGGPEMGTPEVPVPQEAYEPPFTPEASGAFVAANGDTLASFVLELAESTAETTQGMMYRRSVPEGTGMLFIMPDERYQSFWMRNTYVPLDIIYLSEAGTVVSIQANAQPMNETPLPSEGPAKYVLEIAGGSSANLGITPGTNWIWKRN